MKIRRLKRRLLKNMGWRVDILADVEEAMAGHAAYGALWSLAGMGWA